MDAASRYGFDELIILRENSRLIVDRVRRRIKEIIAEMELHRKNPDCGKHRSGCVSRKCRVRKDLLLAAKEALYHAQHSGRNRVAHP